jgi:AcrR family transcriptional regulator
MDDGPIDSMDPDVTRQRIIAAAFKLIGEIGYKRATTRRIAEAAGVNEVTLFRHFGTKKNLLHACAENYRAGGFAANLERYLTDHYPNDMLAMARAMMQSMAEGADYMRLMMCDSMEVPELRETMLDGWAAHTSVLADYFRGQIQAGVVRADLDPETLTHAFESLFSSFLLLQAVFPTERGRTPPDSTIRQLVDIFVLGTMNR